jgi:hypothetical protein
MILMSERKEIFRFKTSGLYQKLCADAAQEPSGSQQVLGNS